jgi:putative FmdB family regulatory protein
MPTYDYHCNCCQKDFEIEHSIKDDPIQECPVCKTASLKRMISKSDFVLIGDGWAKDNYARKN